MCSNTLGRSSSIAYAIGVLGLLADSIVRYLKVLLVESTLHQ